MTRMVTSRRIDATAVRYDRPAARRAGTETRSRVDSRWKQAAWFRTSWIAFSVLAASIPYAVNYAATPAGFHYTWIIPPYHQDSLAYMAWSEQAARGSMLFKIKYTALPHEAFLFHPFFLISGWLKALLSLDIGIVHWLIKGLGIVFFWLVFFRYTDYLKLDRIESLAAAVFAGTSAGFGWFYLRFFGLAENSLYHPMDLWMPEANTFWSLLWNPLFAYSLTLLLLSVYFLERGTTERHAGAMWLAGGAAGLLTLIHPYHVPLLFTLAGCVAAWRLRGQAFAMLARYYGAALPVVALVFSISRLHPLASQHALQGEMPSPSLGSAALGFGFPLLLFLGGVAAGRTAFLKKQLLPATWFVLAVIFSQLPFWFQRKFLFGAHIPLCILAGLSLTRLIAGVAAQRRSAARLAALIVIVPASLATQVFHLTLQRHIVGANDAGAYYIADDLRAAFHYLERGSSPAEIVFAAESTSTLVPAYSGNTVLWGHWAMSLDLAERRAWSERIFAGGANEQAARELAGAGIGYVLVDDAFREQFGEAEPGFLSVYAKTFKSGTVAVYRRAA